MSPPVVLITGCSKGGIGYHLAEEFARRGCTVYASARTPSKIQPTHPGIHTLELDVSSDSSVESAVQTLLANQGRIDILVNNAGIIAAGALLDQTPTQIQEAFNTNTFSVLRLSRAVIPSMARRSSGVIINISSVTEGMPTPWNGLYCATKSAVRAISDVLSMECAPLGIRIVNVAPGSVRSNISSNQITSFSIPDDSLWKAYLPGMIKRINASQGERSMPTDEFARRVVRRILDSKGEVRKGRLDAHVYEGGGVKLFRVLTWLPWRVFVWVMWRVYGKTG